MIRFNDYRIKYYALNKNRVCEKCWEDKDLQVHHKNKHHTDNRIENLMLVCPECHRELHKWDKVYNIMKVNRTPYRPSVEKRIEVIMWNNISLLRTILNNRIHNITKKRLERVYFHIGWNDWVIYEERNG